MTLEAWIYKKLAENTRLTAWLTLFESAPAVFYPFPPKDTDTGWNNEMHYPRIDFEVDRHKSTQKKTAGLVTLNIGCYGEDVLPEAIEREVCLTIVDTFIRQEDQEICILTKVASDLVKELTDASGKTLRQRKIVFEILAFPVQETSNPDPVATLNDFVKTLDSKVLILGKDSLEDQLMNASENPIFYFKLTNVENDRETNAVTWMNAKIAVHVFIKTEELRLKWLKYLADELATRGEVMMLNNAPMFIQKVKVNYKADPLKTGQMKISVQYGILRKTQGAHPLVNAHMINGL